MTTGRGVEHERCMVFAWRSGVNLPTFGVVCRRILCAAILALLAVRPALALSVSTVTRPDTDSLLLQFSKKGVNPNIERIGPAEVSLTFPPGALAGEPKPESVDFGSSRMLESLRQDGDRIIVRLKTDAFGFVGWPEGEQGIKLQVYRDPSGANWTPGTQSKNGSTTSPPMDITAAPRTTPAVTLPVTPPNNKPGPLELPPLPASLAQSPQGGGTPAAGGEAKADPGAAASSKEPFYAVPYSLRAAAGHMAPDKAPILRPAGMHAPGVPEARTEQAAGPGQPPAAAAQPPVKLPPIPKERAAAPETRRAVTPPGTPPPPPAEADKAAPSDAPEQPRQTAAVEKKPATPETPKDPQEELDANQLLAAQAEKLAGKYDVARNMMQEMRAKPNLAPAVREDLLHSLAALNVDQYKDSLAAHYDQIQGSLQEALNFNPNSYRVPEALLLLGMVNLRVGNLPEARGYFNVLTKKYPTDANVPLINFYWGEYYYDNGDYKKATEEYQGLIEKFPESKYVREGAMGLAKTLVRQGRYKEAAQIADYINKRWPRYYIEFPPILRIEGDIAYRNGDFKKARDNYLLFYNMDPKVQDADMVLARLGDIYARLGNKPASVDFYNLAIKDYPNREGGLISKMRLAEQGVYDQPTISEMFTLFDKPAYGSPEEIYRSIIREHPKSPLAPLAQIKLAMWLLYKQNYPESLNEASRYLELFPKTELAPKAEEVAFTAFEKMAADLLADKQYDRLLKAFAGSPILTANRGMLSDTTRLGLALANLRTGNPKQALAEAMPFIGGKESENGQMALTMAMTIYHQDKAWRDIVELARRVQNWKFGPTQRRGLEYMVADALENLGETDRARQIWNRLAGDQALDASKRSYAMYFMAKEAMAGKNYEKAELYAGEAGFLFRETGQDPDKLKASLNIQVDATRELGQYPKAFKLANEYSSLCKEGDDEWAANRMRIASIQRAMGDVDGWRATLTAMRDAAPNSLYGRMAASDLATTGLESRINALTRNQ